MEREDRRFLYQCEVSEAHIVTQGLWPVLDYISMSSPASGKGNIPVFLVLLRRQKNRATAPDMFWICEQEADGVRKRSEESNEGFYTHKTMR
jgi:hypothetical protein